MNFTYWFFATLARIFARLFFSFRIIHRERLPETGGIILAANHQSYFDPPLVGICAHRAVHYLARKTLMEWPFFGPLFPDMNVIPVDRHGNDMSALKTVIRKIREGEGVVLFPEGTRSPDGQLQPAQAGVGLVIAKTLAPVVPMRIFGSYEAFPRGSKGVRFHPIRVVVGEPIIFTKEDVGAGERADYQRLSQRVMDAISMLTIEEPHKMNSRASMLIVLTVGALLIIGTGRAILSNRYPTSGSVSVVFAHPATSPSMNTEPLFPGQSPP